MGRGTPSPREPQKGGTTLLSPAVYIPLLALALALGYGLCVLVNRVLRANASRKSGEIIEQARRDAQNLHKEAELQIKEELLRKREKFETQLGEHRNELRELERRLSRREDQIEQKVELLGKQERTLESSQRKLNERVQEVDQKRQELTELLDKQRKALHEISGMSADTARKVLLERLDQELVSEQGAIILQHDDRLKEVCEQKAREVLATTIQRYAAQHTAETTVSTVDIPNDDMKGRIIGREGRNIRTFEKATGVDVIVDDTPGIVIVSGFDTVRRETAKLALEKLIQDGRIHPSRIEEVVAETQQEMEEHINRLGREAAQEANVHGLHAKIINLLGRLKFRTSYSQNVLRHSIEVAYLTGLMAEELGMDGVLGRRCGLLHDIGKAADHEMEGGHPRVGADLLKRHGEGSEVVHAALGHHDDLRVDFLYTILVNAADAISAARPGARRETLEKYVKRLQELEAVACGFPGVDHAYAVQAGREVRVIADAQHTSDREAAKVCRDIAKAIEEQLTYPGEIKVTVLRETRVVEYAR